ncbi:MAG: hypothetical protein NC191_08710 [Muribaculaceae bacterium]|nr:hypothetical protein [Muribaculaceae bacterium]
MSLKEREANKVSFTIPTIEKLTVIAKEFATEAIQLLDKILGGNIQVYAKIVQSCHAELVSASLVTKTLKRVQGDIRR